MQTGGGQKSPVGSWIATVVLCAALAFGAGFSFGRPGSTLAAPKKTASKTVASDLVVGFESPAPSDVELPADFKEFWKLWRTLREKYYKQPVADKKLFYGAMAGLASSLGDPYTVFFEPTSAQEFNQSLQGKFEGIGAEIGIKDGQLEVIAPLPGTPAEKAGLRPEDMILSIDKQDTTDMSVEKAVSLIRGKKGTTVTLSVGRIKKEKDAKGKEHSALATFDVTITRATIEVKSVRTKYLRDGIALIEISHFNEDTATLFSKAVDEVLAKNAKGLILDLRNNPGGYLDRATAVAGEWVGDQVVVVERQQDKITEKFRGTGQARLRDMPTVVLVNEGSASASEIVAGALQDYAKAKVVGMKTFGKGSVQDYLELDDRSAVKITIAEWLTPKERSIDKVGIQPDVQLERTQDDIHADRDPQLDAALEILTGTKAPKASAK